MGGGAGCGRTAHHGGGGGRRVAARGARGGAAAVQRRAAVPGGRAPRPPRPARRAPRRLPPGRAPRRELRLQGRAGLRRRAGAGRRVRRVHGRHRHQRGLRPQGPAAHAHGAGGAARHGAARRLLRQELRHRGRRLLLHRVPRRVVPRQVRLEEQRRERLHHGRSHRLSSWFESRGPRLRRLCRFLCGDRLLPAVTAVPSCSGATRLVRQSKPDGACCVSYAADDRPARSTTSGTTAGASWSRARLSGQYPPNELADCVRFQERSPLSLCLPGPLGSDCYQTHRLLGKIPAGTPWIRRLG